MPFLKALNIAEDDMVFFVNRASVKAGIVETKTYLGTVKHIVAMECLRYAKTERSVLITWTNGDKSRYPISTELFIIPQQGIR